MEKRNEARMTLVIAAGTGIRNLLAGLLVPIG